ncbi:unnamed protein product, partial [Phaeothamnion confervicola]
TGRIVILDATVARLEAELTAATTRAAATADAAKAAAAAAVARENALQEEGEAARREAADAAEGQAALRQQLAEQQRQLDLQLDKLLEYPRLTEAMAEEMATAARGARREYAVMDRERREIRRQYVLFLAGQSENQELRRQAQTLRAQVVSARRQ